MTTAIEDLKTLCLQREAQIREQAKIAAEREQMCRESLQPIIAFLEELGDVRLNKRAGKRLRHFVTVKNFGSEVLLDGLSLDCRYTLHGWQNGDIVITSYATDGIHRTCQHYSLNEARQFLLAKIADAGPELY